MYPYPDISAAILTAAETCEKALQETFRTIDAVSEANQYKVLSAFRKNRVGEEDFFPSSGYGYHELGREKLERVYADVFHVEDALVRPQITCGTHALYLALSAILLPGDEILFITGKPYDSLEKAIGIRKSPNSLSELGITWKTVELTEGKDFDFDGIRKAISGNTRIIYIQRSRGYAGRSSLSPEQIGAAIAGAKERRPEVIAFVDNCYGEFTALTEPSDHGADLCVGSLIKNPGGGLAPIGGYIAGRGDLIERCSFRLTAPGLGKEVGGSLGVLKSFFQGLSLAPSVTANALKSAAFAAALFESLGYDCSPASGEAHNCIVEAITLRSAEKVRRFCSAIQHSSYVDSYVTPEDSDMPGYEDPVIMASGAFVSGSSIELSADGPLRGPYRVFFQGGLTYEHGKYALMKAAQAVTEA